LLTTARYSCRISPSFSSRKDRHPTGAYLAPSALNVVGWSCSAASSLRRSRLLIFATANVCLRTVVERPCDLWSRLRSPQTYLHAIHFRSAFYSRDAFVRVFERVSRKPMIVKRFEKNELHRLPKRGRFNYKCSTPPFVPKPGTWSERLAKHNNTIIARVITRRGFTDRIK